MAVLDTNVFIRYITDDNADHAPRAYALLQQIERGERTALLPEGVFVEIVQVLESTTYQMDRESIRLRLGAVLAMPGIELPNKRIHVEALDLFIDYSRLSIVDALCVAYAKKHDDQTVITFDRGFRNIPGIVREEP
jgi:uncharacterized protein